ncbi:MAG TPA: hypothetical protein VF283_04295 [Bryobacteraceae bacterium]
MAIQYESIAIEVLRNGGYTCLHLLVEVTPRGRKKAPHPTPVRFGNRAVVDHDLVDRNYGAFEGKTTAEIRKQLPGWELSRDGCPVASRLRKSANGRTGCEQATRY